MIALGIIAYFGGFSALFAAALGTSRGLFLAATLAWAIIPIALVIQFGAK